MEQLTPQGLLRSKWEVHASFSCGRAVDRQLHGPVLAGGIQAGCWCPEVMARLNVNGERGQAEAELQPQIQWPSERYQGQEAHLPSISCAKEAQARRLALRIPVVFSYETAICTHSKLFLGSDGQMHMVLWMHSGRQVTLTLSAGVVRAHLPQERERVVSGLGVRVRGRWELLALGAGQPGSGVGAWDGRGPQAEAVSWGISSSGRALA